MKTTKAKRKYTKKNSKFWKNPSEIRKIKDKDLNSLLKENKVNSARPLTPEEQVQMLTREHELSDAYNRGINDGMSRAMRLLIDKD